MRWIGVLVLLGVSCLSAHGESYFIWDDHRGGGINNTYADAEKTLSNPDDDLLCWAAAAANVLWYTGWGWVGGMTTEDQMFSHFQQHWTDEGGNSYFGWDWWFDGTYDGPTSAGWAVPDVTGGGGFHPLETIGSYRRFSTNDALALETLDAWLRAGYASTISVSGSLAHMITVWGFAYDATGYQGIYVTDSDDDKDGDGVRPDRLVYLPVDFDTTESRWYLSGGYYGTGTTNYIAEVVSLAMKPGYVPIPEPASLLLVVLALGVGAGARRFRREHEG